MEAQAADIAVGKVLAAKSDDLSSIPRTISWKEKTDPCKLFSDFQHNYINIIKCDYLRRWKLGEMGSPAGSSHWGYVSLGTIHTLLVTAFPFVCYKARKSP